MHRLLAALAALVLSIALPAHADVAAAEEGMQDGARPGQAGARFGQAAPRGFMDFGAGPPVRLKDLATFEGVRGNDLVGYGLVVGLAGTGDSLRNSPFTEEALSNLLERLGVNVTGENFRPKNIAAVLVTANLPPFSRAGGRIDVAVSAIGDASSLHGGTLIMTPLNAADGQIYAVAQGPIVAGGIAAETENAAQRIGVPTVGDIPGGASVEREVAFGFETLDKMTLSLRNPDFTTAMAAAEAIERAGLGVAARAVDSRTIELRAQRAGMSLTELVARVERVQVRPDSRAVIVMDQSAGTIVVGGAIPLPDMSITHGGIKINAERQFVAAQPNPFAEGETVVLPIDNVDIQQGPTATLRPEEEATVQDVVEGLSAIGLSALEIMDILQTIKASGLIHTDFVIR
ncbi:flagellar basal body P-ring protein FlgI [Rhodovulum sp. DZ06]|uniref:flagellar basal body P-ring protein FlgI n=1 Tax=Rhodovulum sp. DZ06 TaxID=3425126 RepID=UPI003D333877